MSAIERFLEHLHGVRRNGKGWKAQCPAHDDQHPSLSIDEGDDGRVLLKCWGGCSTEDIVAAAGLRMADLFPKSGRRSGRQRGGGGRTPSRNPSEHSITPPSGLTLTQYAEAKALPETFLASLGLSTIYLDGRPAVRIPFSEADGSEAAVQFRLALRKPEDEPDGRFRWRSGAKPLLYGLNRLDQAREAGYAVIVEGASDCHTLWRHDIPALGLPGANNWREDRDAHHLDGIETIYVVIEPDRGGQAVDDWLGRSRIRGRVRLVSCGKDKDPSGLYLADQAGFLERWGEVLKSSTPWTDREEAEHKVAAAELYMLAEDLLPEPRLLERVGETMAARGYAGDIRPPKLMYVVMTSRLLERPQNAASVAQSASGKNRAIDAALDLIPPEAVHIEKAGSARALIYNEADYRHKVVVVEEADSIPEDGPAAAAIRSLAADNEMLYDVVEKNARTGRFETRRVRKPGPTGLVTTGTRSPGQQLGTRLLEDTVPDDPQQTRMVMHAHARSVMPPKGSAPDVEPFLAAQRWLALAGVKQVAVPFADELADLVPATGVRMRRDFRQLLTCIQAIALLYQCQRARTQEGWVEATIDDYARARELLAPIFDTIAAEGATPAIRATVEAIKPGQELRAAELAKRLNLSKATVSWRVNRAVESGWLVNNETRRGHAHKLALGAPLPEATSALPTPERVREVFEGPNPNRDGRDTPPPAWARERITV